MEPLEILERDLRAKNRARSTLWLYTRTAQRFLVFLAGRPATEAKPADVTAYLERRQAEGLVTWRRELSHLRVFYRSLIDADLLDRSPTDHLHLSHVPGMADAMLRITAWRVWSAEPA